MNVGPALPEAVCLFVLSVDGWYLGEIGIVQSTQVTLRISQVSNPPSSSTTSSCPTSTSVECWDFYWLWYCGWIEITLSLRCLTTNDESDRAFIAAINEALADFENVVRVSEVLDDALAGSESTAIVVVKFDG